ncbi:MAG: hypothetical protein Q8M24_19065 [Pseudolabrys sp.]|nr:hypothetical protein [Pseudolabrys sp.]MDP2297548.1 hypothetical protein [Pseudolabrys sp.]
MSNVANPAAFRRPLVSTPARVSAPARRTPWRWLYDAVMLARERQTQRDIDRVVSWRDGGFNDAFEREIAERHYSDGWNFRR